MHYFSKVEVKQKVFSLIYGRGVVIFALSKAHRLDGFHIFAAKYKKRIVYYTVDGLPNWSAKDGSCQTVFYEKDINFKDVDMQEPSLIPSEKQILKWQNKGLLEIQCPSGIWRNVEESPQDLIKKALKKSKYHLFRKQNTKHY